MADVSVIGLGPMGVAIANGLLREGHRTTVWNRTLEKAEPLARAGASIAKSAAAAVTASPFVITCVSDYRVTRSVLDAKEVVPLLANRVLIELSTGTPQDARDAEAWARERRADYLDGAIMATPSQMGRPDTAIFVSGAESVFRKSAPVLAALTGNPTYTGESVGAAAAWDLGLLSFLWGAFLGFFHGARTLEIEGMRVDGLGGAIVSLAPVLGEMVKRQADAIQSGDYDHPESSLRTCALSVDLIVRQAHESRISGEIPAFFNKLFSGAMAAGYGEQEPAAIMKLLRSAV